MMSTPSATVVGDYDPNQPRTRTFFDARQSFLDSTSTPRDYLEECLSTIDKLEPVVQAWVCLNTENARLAADESTRRYSQGNSLSPIDGMPIGIKDVLQTHDMPTTLGSPIFAGRNTGMDSASVNALRLAGAVITGKTVTTEFALMVPGPTTNPYSKDATPGGSSSGSSAAVGAGMVPVALGNQVVGSVIRPAAYCANYAIKPTLGALHGGEGASWSQLHVGVHAGSLEDMWAVAYEIGQRAGGDPGYPGLYGPQALAPAKMPESLIVLETEGWSQCNDTTLATFDALLGQLSDQGVRLISRKDNQAIDRFEKSIDKCVPLSRILCSYENRWALRAYKRTGLLSEQLGVWLSMAEELGPDDYREALQKRDAMRADMAALQPLADGLFTLSAPGPAPGIGFVTGGEDTYGFVTGDPAFNAATSSLGCPAITVPLMSIGSMPVGAQFIGHLHRDWQLCGHARWAMDTLEPVVQ
jgi:Asp-tRNA(Asn)/Glu-tRNA(Gln) amidotransferase A subunit family amidase